VKEIHGVAQMQRHQNLEQELPMFLLQRQCKAIDDATYKHSQQDNCFFTSVRQTLHQHTAAVQLKMTYR